MPRKARLSVPTSDLKQAKIEQDNVSKKLDVIIKAQQANNDVLLGNQRGMVAEFNRLAEDVAAIFDHLGVETDAAGNVVFIKGATIDLSESEGSVPTSQVPGGNKPPGNYSDNDDVAVFVPGPKGGKGRTGATGVPWPGEDGNNNFAIGVPGGRGLRGPAGAPAVTEGTDTTTSDFGMWVPQNNNEIDAHLADTSDAHDASAISADSATLVGTGTDVQAVLEELDNGIVDHAAAADPHTGYRLESADHTHATTGLQGGTVAHSALTGVSSDQHHAQAHTHDEDDLIPDTVEVDESFGFLGPGNLQNVIYRKWVTDATTVAGDIMKPDATAGRVEPTTSSSDVIIGVAMDAGNAGDTIRVALFGIVQVMWDTLETAAIGTAWSTGSPTGQARAANSAAGLSSHTYRGGWALEDSASGSDRLVWCYLNPTVAGIVSGVASSTITALVTTAESSLSAEVVVGTTPGGELDGTWATPTVDATHSGSTHAAATDTHIADTADAHDASAISADSTTLVGTGTDVQAVLEELDNGIVDHAAAADPHTGYRLESADHSHASTGLQAGNIAATAVTVDSTNLDGTATNVQTVFEELETQVQSAASTHAAATDPHTGYVLESLAAAKGDIYGASADNTPAITTVGADDTILMADAAAAAGLKWVASASPSAVGTVAVTGTADTFTRGDHVHAHETGHVAHDTLWDAKGDVVTASAADTAVRTAVGTDGYRLTADSASSGGVAWKIVPQVDVFTGAGTWTKPTGATWVKVIAIGGGGGGGSGKSDTAGTTRYGGGGGGGGEMGTLEIAASVLAATEGYSVGAGGAGSVGIATQNGTQGTDGGDSWFGNSNSAETIEGAWLAVQGGDGGGAGTGVSGTGGASGGNDGTTHRHGPFQWYGGSGGNGNSTAGSVGDGPPSVPGLDNYLIGGAGGGGGAGGLDTGNTQRAGGDGGGWWQTAGGAGGAVASNGSAPIDQEASSGMCGAGGGGAGSVNTGTDGGAGGLYGGGGGGGSAANNSNESTGGAGADGIVVVIAW